MEKDGITQASRAPGMQCFVLTVICIACSIVLIALHRKNDIPKHYWQKDIQALSKQLPSGVEVTKIENGGNYVAWHFRVSTSAQLQELQRLSQRKARPDFERFIVTGNGREFGF